MSRCMYLCAIIIVLGICLHRPPIHHLHHAMSLTVETTTVVYRGLLVVPAAVVARAGDTAQRECAWMTSWRKMQNLKLRLPQRAGRRNTPGALLAAPLPSSPASVGAADWMAAALRKCLNRGALGLPRGP